MFPWERSGLSVAGFALSPRSKSPETTCPNRSLPMLSADLIDRLRAIDTPTICNAIELLAPARRTFGFNRQPLICPFPEMRPVVGYARTATIRSREPSPTGDPRARRIAYYEYVEKG